MTVVQNIDAPGVPPGTSGPPNARTTLVTRQVLLRAPLEVVPADTQTVRLITPEVAAPSIASIRSIQASKGLPRPGEAAREIEHAVAAEGALHIPTIPVGMAFHILWRQGEREWTVGQIVREANAHPSH